MTTIPPRRRGAQPGNSNRRIHGYYARDTRGHHDRLSAAAVDMHTGLAAFGAMAVRLAALKRSSVPTRKKREIEHQMTLLYFELCQRSGQTARALALPGLEPVLPATGSNGPAPVSRHSNPALDTPPAASYLS